MRFVRASFNALAGLSVHLLLPASFGNLNRVQTTLWPGSTRDTTELSTSWLVHWGQGQSTATPGKPGAIWVSGGGEHELCRGARPMYPGISELRPLISHEFLLKRDCRRIRPNCCKILIAMSLRRMVRWFYARSMILRWGVGVGCKIIVSARGWWIEESKPRVGKVAGGGIANRGSCS
jgi:hypothetical protein